jgi:hypothetical protein
MTAPSHATAADQTEAPLITRASIKLGIIQTAIIVVIGVLSRVFEGPAESASVALVLLVGLAVSAGLPGIWTNARTLEGIAGAAGIGLGASAVFLVLDMLLLQGNIPGAPALYTNRWLEVGGGSNWWYHPVWWMVAAYLGWMGAWVLANQAEQGKQPSIGMMMGVSVALTLVVGAIAVLAHFPGAGWNVPTFGVAYLVGITLAVPATTLLGRKAA